MLISRQVGLIFVCILASAVLRHPVSAGEDDWVVGMDEEFTNLRDSGQSRDEMNDIMSLLQSMARQLANLKSVIHNLKIHSQIIYKQVHRVYKDKCNSAASSRKVRDPLPGGKYPSTSGKDFASSVYQNHEAGITSELTKISCPSGFQLSIEAKKCYRVESAQRVSWRLARDRCKSIGAELLSIGSAREQNIISDMLRKKKAGKCDYWTGLTATRRMSHLDSPFRSSSSSSGSKLASSKPSVGDVHWYWAGDGSTLGQYTNWNENEPNNVNEHSSSPSRDDGVCVQMLWIFNWKWNDASCNQSAACFICQTPSSTGKSNSKNAPYIRIG